MSRYQKTKTKLEEVNENGIFDQKNNVGFHPMIQYSQELINQVEKLENGRNRLKREIDLEENMKKTLDRELEILGERLSDADGKNFRNLNFWKFLDLLEKRKKEREGLISMMEEARLAKVKIDEGMEGLLQSLKRENDYIKSINPDIKI